MKSFIGTCPLDHLVATIYVHYMTAKRQLLKGPVNAQVYVTLVIRPARSVVAH